MQNVRKTEIGQEHPFGYRRPQGKHVLISIQLFYLPPHKTKQNYNTGTTITLDGIRSINMARNL